MALIGYVGIGILIGILIFGVLPTIWGSFGAWVNDEDEDE